MQVSKISREDHFKINGVVCHCFSPDGKQIAVSLKNDLSVEIYNVVDINNINTWTKAAVLKDAGQTISSLDWSPLNIILQTSFDRSVMVWNHKSGDWIRDLVVIENSRAALIGKWNSTSKKFAIGSGEHNVFIGYYENNNTWWQTKLAIDFHPSSRLVAVGSTDHTFTILTCAITETKNKKEVVQSQYEDLDYKGPFDNIQNFGETIFALKPGATGGWVTGLHFSPNKLDFVFSCHNCTIQTGKLNPQENTADTTDVYVLKSLPVTQVLFTNDNDFVAAGYDGRPYQFTIKDNKIQEKNEIADSETTVTQKRVSNVENLTQMWGAKAKTQTQTKTQSKKKHETPITCMRIIPKTTLVSTSDINGQIFSWKI